MQKTKAGIVAVASQYESGGQRAESLIQAAVKALDSANIAPIAASKIAWDAADCIAICKEFKKQDVDSLTIILSTWVTDSLLYVLVHEMAGIPVVFWAVPYTETFSIGCVQHFGSALMTHGIPYEYVYGLADDAELIKKVARIAEVGRTIKQVKNAKLALLGPRQTWRVAGPQDTTNEEWEFSGKFGVTLVHVEMEEVTAIAGSIGNKEAETTLNTLKKRTGKVAADKAAMLHMAKIYSAMKQIIARYSLDIVAAECYPNYSGLMNLPSSWLADEGIIVDTEGDIGHAVVMYMLNLAAKGGATALGEIGSFEDLDRAGILNLAHEGSSAHSLAENLKHVQISPSGDNGAFVGLPLKPMPTVTVSSIQGKAGLYQMLVERGSVVKASHEEWVEGGEKLLAKLKLNLKGSDAIDKLMALGLDHHLLVKEGDYTDFLRLICKFLGIKAVSLT